MVFTHTTNAGSIITSRENPGRVNGWQAGDLVLSCDHLQAGRKITSTHHLQDSDELGRRWRGRAGRQGAGIQERKLQTQLGRKQEKRFMLLVMNIKMNYLISIFSI